MDNSNMQMEESPSSSLAHTTARSRVTIVCGEVSLSFQISTESHDFMTLSAKGSKLDAIGKSLLAPPATSETQVCLVNIPQEREKDSMYI